MNHVKHLSLLLGLAMGCAAASAEAPAGYYDSCNGKSGTALLTQLQSIVGPHTNVGYGGLWDVYKTSDVRPDGTLWDIYTTKTWPSNFTRCGNYSVIGDCVNREHSFPKSWWGGSQQTQYSDAFHLYPTDGKVNGQRSNFPYGECAYGSTLPSAGSVKALGRLGSCTAPGFSGTVFEPDDQYKGDLARTYFYMAAAYYSQIKGWTSGNGKDIINGGDYVYKDWYIDLMLKWHRADPVSAKERDRNDAIYKHQRNRNPFIDNPDLAEYIWGNHKGEAWSPAGTKPAIITPVSGSTIDMGSTMAGQSLSATVTVTAANLESNISLSVSGAGFSVTPSAISRSAASSADGATATVTYTSPSTGNATGTLTLRSGDLTTTVNLRAAAIDHIPAGPVRAIAAESFTATWTYVGDDRPGRKYSLDVRRGDTSIAGYPRDVNAADGYFTVTDLEPLTAYTYTVSSASHTSGAVSVTTTAPVPYVDFLYDDEPMIYATAGEPSAAIEILVEYDYLPAQPTVAVESPFEISTDKSDWRHSLTLADGEDRIYLRVNAADAGTYMTSLKATAGDYYNDDADFIAIVTPTGSAFMEDFEASAEGQGTYDRTDYRGTACLWELDDAGIWGNEGIDNSQAVRLGKTATSAVTMNEDWPVGFGTVTLHAQSWGSKEGGKFELEYSTDGGQSWRSAGSAETADNGGAWQKFTFTVNTEMPSRLRIRQTEGGRWLLDQIEATRYSGIADAEIADYHRWDAYARGGELVIETSEPVVARVYSLDAIEVFRGRVTSERRIALPAGLYIVAVDDFARRVLVK